MLGHHDLLKFLRFNWHWNLSKWVDVVHVVITDVSKLTGKSVQDLTQPPLICVSYFPNLDLTNTK